MRTSARNGITDREYFLGVGQGAIAVGLIDVEWNVEAQGSIPEHNPSGFNT